jgi:hypothetical protein
MPNQRAAFGRPSDLPRSQTAGLVLVRQPSFALHRTVDTGRVALQCPHRWPFVTQTDCAVFAR